MAKLIDRGWAKRDDPMFSEGFRVLTVRKFIPPGEGAKLSTPQTPESKADGHIGPYWDALRTLKRVVVGGSLTSGMVFSQKPLASDKRSPDLREHYQKAASMSLLMSEEQILQELSPKQRDSIKKAQQLRLSRQSFTQTPKTTSTFPKMGEPSPTTRFEATFIPKVTKKDNPPHKTQG